MNDFRFARYALTLHKPWLGGEPPPDAVKNEIYDLYGPKGALPSTDDAACWIEFEKYLRGLRIDSCNFDGDKEVRYRRELRLFWITVLVDGIAPDVDEKRIATEFRNRSTDKWHRYDDPESYFTGNQSKRNRPGHQFSAQQTKEAQIVIDRMNAEARQDEGVTTQQMRRMHHSDVSCRNVSAIITTDGIENKAGEEMGGGCLTGFGTITATKKCWDELNSNATKTKVPVVAATAQTGTPSCNQNFLEEHAAATPGSNLNPAAMNAGQKAVYAKMIHCMDAAAKRMRKRSKSGQSMTGKHQGVFIHGGPGSGKSTLINAATDAANLLGLTTIKMAPMASAANLIGGLTMHTAAGLGRNLENIDPDKLSDSEKARLVALQGTEKAWALIIDEISAVSSQLFNYVDRRFRNLYNNDEPFGGLPVFIFGDFFQLPPPGGTTLFDVVVRRFCEGENATAVPKEAKPKGRKGSPDKKEVPKAPPQLKKNNRRQLKPYESQAADVFV